MLGLGINADISKTLLIHILIWNMDTVGGVHLAFTLLQQDFVFYYYSHLEY